MNSPSSWMKSTLLGAEAIASSSAPEPWWRSASSAPATAGAHTAGIAGHVHHL